MSAGRERLYVPELAEPVSPVRTLLANYTTLKFSGEQRAQLEAVDRALTVRNRAVLDSARTRDPELFDAGRTSGADSVAARRAEDRTMRRRADRIERYVRQLRRNQEDAVEQAMQVLRPAQRDVAKRLLADWRRRSNATY